MGGWKVVGGVTLCSQPCCIGYEERLVKAPLLASPVICHKLTEEELKVREEARTTTTPLPQLRPVTLLDEVRERERERERELCDIWNE